MKSKHITITAVIAIASLFICPFAETGLYGYLVGATTGKKVDLGPSGAVSQITLTIDSLDGNVWTIVCRRSDANLGLCDPVQLGDIIASDGPVLPISSPSKSCGWISPNTMHVFP